MGVGGQVEEGHLELTGAEVVDCVGFVDGH